MRRDRALWVALLALVVVFGIFHLRSAGPSGSVLPDCAFHNLTGLYCAGCGMTRATHAALHGRLIEAFGHNPFGVLMFPLLGLVLAAELIHWVRGRRHAPRLRPGPRALVALAAAILVFMVLRNLPHAPFAWLAPD